jgi:hypothetical protein
MHPKQPCDTMSVKCFVYVKDCIPTNSDIS